MVKMLHYKKKLPIWAAFNHCFKIGEHYSLTILSGNKNISPSRFGLWLTFL